MLAKNENIDQAEEVDIAIIHVLVRVIALLQLDVLIKPTTCDT